MGGQSVGSIGTKLARVASGGPRGSRDISGRCAAASRTARVAHGGPPPFPGCRGRADQQHAPSARWSVRWRSSTRSPLVVVATWHERAGAARRHQCLQRLAAPWGRSPRRPRGLVERFYPTRGGTASAYGSRRARCQSVQARLDVRAIARPLLEQLEAETGETATLSLPATPSAVTIDFVPSPGQRPLDGLDLAGAALPTPPRSGKVMLAFGEVGLDALAHALRGLHRADDQGPGQAAGRGRGGAQRGRRTCGAGARGRPQRRGGAGARLPRGARGDPRPAGPAGRFTEEAMTAALRALRAAASELGRALGGR